MDFKSLKLTRNELVFYDAEKNWVGGAPEKFKLQWQWLKD